MKDWGNHGRIHIDARYAILKYNKSKISWKNREHKFVVDPEKMEENMDIDDDFESFFSSESEESKRLVCSSSTDSTEPMTSLLSSDAFSDLSHLTDEMLTSVRNSLGFIDETEECHIEYLPEN